MTPLRWVLLSALVIAWAGFYTVGEYLFPLALGLQIVALIEGTRDETAVGVTLVRRVDE